MSKIQAYWKTSNRLTVTALPDEATNGRYRLRLTPEGSQWLWQYDSWRGIGKMPPGVLAPPLTPDQQRWDAWVKSKLALDQTEAAARCRYQNILELGVQVPNVGLIPEVEPMPDDLRVALGEPPALAEVAHPFQYSVKFDEPSQYAFQDNVSVPLDYRHYRFRKGVRSFGSAVRKLPEAVLQPLFKRAGISNQERKIFGAVSLLEGGFDAVNTYDTGYVSIGFIQFACLRDGAGSLGEVLLVEKRKNPAQFESDFRRFGIDVSPDGRLVALAIDTGRESLGRDAALEIIGDPRLGAVFARAGARSDAFREAQLRVAKGMYYPLDDSVIAVVNGSLVVGRVSEFIHSEAGLATLMDRKVNTGKLENLGAIVADVSSKYKLASLNEVATYEREVVSRMRFRKDFLLDSTLTQPAPLPALPP